MNENETVLCSCDQTPRKQTKTSNSISSIAKAMSAFQKEVVNPANTTTNPFYKSKYAPLPEVLNALRPLLGKYGLSVIQNTYNTDDKVSIVTLVTHESGEWIETDALVLKPEKNTPQGVGSAITYGRRYALSAVFGIASEEDDDGNTNEKNKSPQKPDSKTPPPKGSNDALNKEISQIDILARELAAIDEAGVTKAIKADHTSANYNAIKDIEVAKKVLSNLTQLKNNIATGGQG